MADRVILVVVSVGGFTFFLVGFPGFFAGPRSSIAVCAGAVGCSIVSDFIRSSIDDRDGAALDLRVGIGRESSEGAVGGCTACTGPDQAGGLCSRARPPPRLGVVLELLSEDDGPRDMVGFVFSPVDDAGEYVLVSTQPDNRWDVAGQEEGALLIEELFDGVRGIRDYKRWWPVADRGRALRVAAVVAARGRGRRIERLEVGSVVVCLLGHALWSGESAFSLGIDGNVGAFRL